MKHLRFISFIVPIALFSIFALAQEAYAAPCPRNIQCRSYDACQNYIPPDCPAPNRCNWVRGTVDHLDCPSLVQVPCMDDLYRCDSPLPGPGCTWSAWSNTSCGGGSCAANQMQQRRTATSGSCSPQTQCAAATAPASASCNAGPGPGPGCTWSPWANVVCGGGSCSAIEMQQRRTTTSGGCSAQTRCAAATAPASASCSAPPGPPPPPACVFTASPNLIVIPPLQFISLEWDCENVANCSIDQGVGNVVVPDGSVLATPSRTALYTLTCTGTDGSNLFSSALVRVFNFIGGVLREIRPQ